MTTWDILNKWCQTTLHGSISSPRFYVSQDVFSVQLQTIFAHWEWGLLVTNYCAKVNFHMDLNTLISASMEKARLLQTLNLG